MTKITLSNSNVAPEFGYGAMDDIRSSLMGHTPPVSNATPPRPTRVITGSVLGKTPNKRDSSVATD